MSVKSKSDLTTENTNLVVSQINPESITPATLGGSLIQDIIDSMLNSVDDNPVYGNNTVANPAGMSGVNMKLMGLGTIITPNRTGNILIQFSGEYVSDTTSLVTRFDLWTGTGSPPANGTGIIGPPSITLRGIWEYLAPSATLRNRFAQSVVIALTKGVSYWVDLGIVNANAGSVQLYNVSLTAFEN